MSVQRNTSDRSFDNRAALQLLDCITTSDPLQGARLALRLLVRTTGAADAQLFVAREGRPFGRVTEAAELEEVDEAMGAVCELVLLGDQPISSASLPCGLDDHWMVPLHVDGVGVGVLGIEGQGVSSEMLRIGTQIVSIHAERLFQSVVRRRADALIRKLSSYLPDEVLRDLRANPEDAVAATGRWVEAVAMFVDLCGFTALTERTSPASVVELLNRYFTLLHSAVDKHGGRVDKHIGDAALLVFEPEYDETPLDCIRRAMEAAAELLHRSVAIAGFPVHIAAAFGDVMVGNVGSAHRYELTTIGDPVNLAARLQEFSEQGQVAVDGPIERAIRDLNKSGGIVPLVVKDRKVRRVRGRKGRVEVSVLEPRR